MMVKVEAARSAVYYAGCVAATERRGAARGRVDGEGQCDRSILPARRRTRCRCFGGVGFTWEYDVHLYFKRARSSASFLGDASWHRERVARAIGL